jgi:lysine-N-methylase
VGVRVSTEEVRAFFGRLDELGFLGEATESEETGVARDLPIAPLPDYGFACDGRGGCCRMFDTILFSELEVARARATLPTSDAQFMPEHGVDGPCSVASRHEGGCMYLARDRRCGLHAAGGAMAKPLGCRTFPVRFLDVGNEIRVLPQPACTCVFAVGEAPLTHATRGSELARETFVQSLPPRVAIGPELVAASDAVRFSDTLSPEGDRAAFCWNLAHALAGEREPSFATPAIIRRALSPVSASVERLARLFEGWRAEDDLVRLSLGWIAEALVRLLAEDSMPEPDEEDEELYVRIGTFGVLGVERPVEQDLRQRAVAIWIARAFPKSARSTPEGRHPIALVEAMARGHGLDLG